MTIDERPTTFLAPRGEAAGMRHRQPQEFVRVHWSVVDAYFVMQMWTSAATAQPDISDGISPAHILPRNDRIAGKMPVAGGDSVAMVESDGASVSAHEVGERNHAVGGSDHRLPVGSRDINSAMKCTLAVERISSLSEGSRDRTFHRPKVRSRISPQPVCGSGISS